jgi:hypothetical protein
MDLQKKPPFRNLLIIYIYNQLEKVHQPKANTGTLRKIEVDELSFISELVYYFAQETHHPITVQEANIKTQELIEVDARSRL